jgi:hypothetical protein
MKFNPFTRTTFLVFLLALVLLTACKKKKDPEPVPETERVTALLKGSTPWAISDVTVDGVVLDLYQGLEVTFTDGAYTSLNGGVIWPASGTWRFKDETAKVMIREDDLELTILEIAEQSMTVEFIWAEDVFEGGRSKAVAGRHVMILGR